MKKYWLNYKINNTVILLLMVVGSISEIGASVLLARVIQTITMGLLDAFLQSIALTVGVWLLSLLAKSLQSYMESITLQAMSLDMRRDLVSCLSDMNYTNFHKVDPNTYSSYLNQDMESIETNYFQGIYELISTIIILLISSIAMMTFHSTLLIVSIILGLTLLLIPTLFMNRLERIAKKISQLNEEITAKVVHWLGGFDVLFGTGKTSLLVEKIIPEYKKLADEKVASGRTSALIQFVVSALNLICQLSIITLTGYLAIQGVVSATIILSTGNIAGVIFNGIAQSAVIIAQIVSGQAVIKQLKNQLTVITKKDSECFDLSGDIEQIELYSVTYKNKSTEIKYPDMVLEKGKNYALVGPSGSGKTTLFNILSGRITDYEGTILVNGIDLRDINLDSAYKSISYINQKGYVFEGTVTENVTVFEEVGDQDYQFIAQSACLQELEANRHLDYQQQLSGGQAQRLNFARGIYQAKSVLLIDEITANLDAENAQRIEETIFSLTDKIKVSITHQLCERNRHLYDEIIVLG